MAAAVRAGFVDGIFEAVGDTERDPGGFPKLYGALSIPVQKRQSGGGPWKDELKNVPGRLDAIIGASHKDCGQEQD